jgi:putative sugar O-methyltransferase
VVSRFWQKLAEEQSTDLETHGFAFVKRVQALWYFTWRWKGDQLIGDWRYILNRTDPIAWIRAAVTPANLAREDWLPAAWTRLHRWTYTIATRLLWEVALKEGSRDVLALAEPTLGAPFPVRWRGRLISQDLANTSLEMASIEEALEGRSPKHVVEIGAGYGRTAHAILSCYPDASYTVVDIHPAIDISHWYLRTLFPDRDLTFIDAELGVPHPVPFDLAISISSLQEMTLQQVTEYLRMVDTSALPGAVVYFKQWARWWNPDDEVELTMSDYRLPDRWRMVFERRARVQQRFGEAGWRAPLK